MTFAKWLPAVLLSIAASTSALALNFSFLNNAAVSYFSNGDYKLMESAADQALDQGKDGQKITWKNPNTTAWGYFIPKNTTRKNGVVCRNLTIFNSAKDVTGLATYPFCKLNGDWKIVN